MCLHVLVVRSAAFALFFPQELHLVPVGVQLPSQGVVLLLQRRLRLIIHSWQEKSKPGWLSLLLWQPKAKMFHNLIERDQTWQRPRRLRHLLVSLFVCLSYRSQRLSSSCRDSHPNRRQTSPSPPPAWCPWSPRCGRSSVPGTRHTVGTANRADLSTATHTHTQAAVGKADREVCPHVFKTVVF